MPSKFEERLSNILGTLKEDRRPKIGIWYYLYLRPKWKLWTYEIIDSSKNISHMEAWQVLVQDEIAPHYKLNESQIEELKDLPYGMPRGRVDTASDLLQSSAPPSDNRWFIFHGDDFPLPKDPEIKKIISKFDLIHQFHSGRLEIRVSEHEKMSKEHTQAVMEMLDPNYYPIT